MSKKHFSWLLLLTVLAFVLVLLVPARTSKDSSIERSALLPELAAIVNELDYLRLTAGGAETIATLERKADSWHVLEVSSYPADWTRLQSLLTALSVAEVVEEKTSNPEFYSRLGVEDISIDSAGGVLIEFASATGLPALIVGQKATGRDGQYVRLADAQSSALIDRDLDVPGDRMQWLVRDIIDIADGEVVEVSITHPDGERVEARKFSADDTDFLLQNISPGREIKSNWSVNSMGGGMAALSLDEVIPVGEIDWSEAVVFSLLTADGLRANARLVQSEEAYWISVEATVYQPVDDGSVPGDDALADDVNTRADLINERVRGWAYRIPQNKYEVMTRRMDDLLQPLEAPST